MSVSPSNHSTSPEGGISANQLTAEIFSYFKSCAQHVVRLALTILKENTPNSQGSSREVGQQNVGLSAVGVRHLAELRPLQSLDLTRVPLLNDVGLRRLAHMRPLRLNQEGNRTRFPG